MTKREHRTFIISTGYEQSLDINEQLEKVIKRVSPKTNVLKEIKAMYSLDFLFAIVVNVENNEKPSMYFAASLLNLPTTLNRNSI